MKSYTKKIILFFLLISGFSCQDQLEEEIFSQLSPESLFTTESGATSVLNGAYSYAHRSGAVESWAPFFMGGMTAGEIWGAGGSIESLWVNLIEFTWDSNHSQIQSMWTVYFNAVRNANIVLDNIDNDSFSPEFIAQTTAEANFIRGWAYSELYNLFGAVPLYKTSSDSPLQPRATEAEVTSFIEQELQQAAAVLPLEARAFGRATKGAALGVLCKYYMNTNQWQNAATISKQIMDLGYYGLEGDYYDVFNINNEENKEIIWSMTKVSTGASQQLNALVFPPDYPRPYPNNGVFAARTYLFDEFVNSFEETDSRSSLIITEYVSTASGATVPGLGVNRSFPYKYEFDPNAVGSQAGNDFPIVRYADILLSRAEALNELSGPSQDAIDLINEVRVRANATPLTLSGFDQESLRDAILQERAWEFYFEGKRREDLIRQGRFISDAIARGKNAQPFHVLFPIPQVELDASDLIQQNVGY
ncbi:MAG: RagB/SusD family nutrient uptake outer membrane protein [Imperialibacter sp.]|uniref:RagB/SusD family nutrient uptake outer membrane protein n=1 Tax=Imperialibacter sp. TaxID=2038411 RepID=UPI0032EFB4EF